LNIIFHLFFHTPFLFGRTALQWLPVGLLLIFIFLDDLNAKLKLNRYFILLLSIFFCGTIVVHFFRQININYCFEWREQAESRKCLEDLSALHPKRAAIHKWIGGVYVNYYRIIDTSLAKINPDGINEEELRSCKPGEIRKLAAYDYIIISQSSTLDCMRANGIRYTIINNYRYTNDRLVRIDQIQ
jgi:hypothetical protein